MLSSKIELGLEVASEKVIFFSRRVHISRASLESLNDAFDVEPGSGGDRDQFLADNNIETFLIVGRKKTASVGKQSREAIQHIFILDFWQFFGRIIYLTT